MLQALVWVPHVLGFLAKCSWLGCENFRSSSRMTIGRQTFLLTF